MAEGKFIAYLRVSTQRQGASGLGIEAQRAAVNAFLSGGRWELMEEFVETESGKRNDRPQLAAALAAAKRQKATLVIARLDRLSRNASFLLALRDSRVDFIACDMPQADRFTVGILALVAEREREMIAARTKAALAAAKARGTVLGGPRLAEVRQQGADKVRAAADQFAANVLPVVSSIQQAGVTSLIGIARALNARGIKTVRGGAWHASTVANLMMRNHRCEM